MPPCCRSIRIAKRFGTSQVLRDGSGCLGATTVDSRISILRCQNLMSSHIAPKEKRIIALVAQGLKNSDIAAIVGTTEYVVKNYLKTIFDKTGMWTRLELALWYVKGT